MLVSEYLEQEGIEPAELAERLNSVTGTELGGRGVNLRKNKEMPKAWAVALGLSVDVPSSQPPESGEPAARQSERPPKKPEGSALMPIATDMAQQRIAEAYGLIGYGLALATENEGVKMVTDDQSQAIARAWVKAADTSEFARRVVRLASAGGAMSELVICHLVWLAGVAYVIGAAPDVSTGSFTRKYGRYRPVVAEPQHDAAAAADGNGGQPAGAPVGVPPS